MIEIMLKYITIKYKCFDQLYGNRTQVKVTGKEGVSAKNASGKSSYRQVCTAFFLLVMGEGGSSLGWVMPSLGRWS